MAIQQRTMMTVHPEPCPPSMAFLLQLQVTSLVPSHLSLGASLYATVRNGRDLRSFIRVVIGLSLEHEKAPVFANSPQPLSSATLALKPNLEK